MAKVYEYHVQATLVERKAAPCLMVFRIKYDDFWGYKAILTEELELLAGELIGKLPEADRGGHDFTCCDMVFPLDNMILTAHNEQILSGRLCCMHADEEELPLEVLRLPFPTDEEDGLLIAAVKRLRRLNPPTHKFQIRRGARKTLVDLWEDPRGRCWCDAGCCAGRVSL